MGIDMKSYIVMGHTGEHDDHSQWLVASYTDPERAISHRDLANEQAKQFGGDHWGVGYCDEDGNRNWDEFEKLRVKQRVATSPYDPQIVVDYTGAWYTILVVDLDPNSFKNLERAALLQGG
jgi:hypothetical protein